MNKDTSWNTVAEWYDNLLVGEGKGKGTYQKDLISPNLLRLMDIRRGDAVLDLACGQGFFAHEFAVTGAKVIGVDASHALITIAKSNAAPGMHFHVSRANELPFLKNKSIDKIAIVLALQNIHNVGDVFRECARVLAPRGTGYVVLNHPAFRIPKGSSWGWDEKEKVQYRRIDQYLSESKVNIDMHPGKTAAGKTASQTVSFHRPLQFYFKALHKAGFAVTGLEEWNSHRVSEPGLRAAAEDKARKEIPLFLCLTIASLSGPYADAKLR